MKNKILLIGFVTELIVFILPVAFAGGKSEARPSKIIIRAGHVNPPGEPAYEAWEVSGKKCTKDWVIE